MSIDHLVDNLQTAIVVAHHVKGRIRLKFVRAGSLPPVSLIRFEQQLLKIPGINNVRLNKLARSCTLEYQPDVLPSQGWEDFFATVASADANTIKTALRSHLQEVLYD